MTPEERQQFDELKEKVEMLVNGLSNASQTSPEMAKTMGDVVLEESSVSASTHQQSVNEAGTSSYSVADAPDGYKETTDGKKIPYYN